MYRQALERQEWVLRHDHPDTLSNSFYLRRTLEEQGRYEPAEAMYQQALSGCERVLGPDNTLTLNCVSNLSLVLQRHGLYERAQLMLRRVLEETGENAGSRSFTPAPSSGAWALSLKVKDCSKWQK
ncbi:hypothetical protein VTN49DRAFT_2016 [Thermomyces lanuginosus]|uniref:uncharacterized protein n=1 Tax=Thermomyces lanuginosus TaxID=5541 RepID=UPI0037442CCE